jgi:transposase
VILDNGSIHLGEEVRRVVEAAGAHLVYLPPYSPDFSPIENFWSKVKSLLKTMGARSSQALLEAIEIAFKEYLKPISETGSLTAVIITHNYESRYTINQ